MFAFGSSGRVFYIVYGVDCVVFAVIAVSCAGYLRS